MTYNFYNVSHKFEYDSSDHITYASVNQVNTDADSHKLEEISMSWKFSWNGDLLSKVEITGQSNGIEGDDQMNYTNHYSYDESVENRFMQYTYGVVESTDLQASFKQSCMQVYLAKECPNTPLEFMASTKEISIT